MSLLWLYAVVESTPPHLPAATLGGSALEVVSGGGLIAITERLAERPATDPRTLARHDRTVRDLARSVPVLLPARFGQTSADEAELSLRLAERAAQLAAALDRVRGCEQVTLRLLPRELADGPVAAPGAAAPDPAEDEATRSLGPGRRHLRRLARGQATPELGELIERLGPLVRETRTRRGPAPCIATAYHLVERRHLEALREAAERLTPPPGTLLRVSSPAPPYAFVEP